MESDSQRDLILEKNPKIDLKIIQEFDKIEEELKKFGVEFKSKFTLEAPLSDRYYRSHLKGN